MKKTLKKVLAVLISVMLVIGLCACSESEGQAETNEAAAATGEAAVAAVNNHTAKNPFKEDVKIAYVPNRASDSVGAAWGVGLTKYFSNYSTISFQIFDGEGNAETQIGIFADLLEQQYDGVIVQLVDSTAENQALTELEDAGIPVISLNIAPTIQHTAKITLSSYSNQVIMAEKACELAGYKGEVAIIGYPPEVSKLLSDNGIQAWYDVVAQYPDMKVVDEQPGDFTTEGGNEIMRDYLTKYPDLTIVFGGTDAMAEGCAMAAQAAGREGIQIWGADGETKALEYIEQGLLTGTLYTNYYDMSTFAGQLMLYAIESPFDLNQSGLDENGEPLTFKFPSVVVTKDNVAEITERW